MMRFILQVGAAISGGVIVLFAGIVLTVAIFPAARDELIRGIVQSVNHAANQGDQP